MEIEMKIVNELKEESVFICEICGEKYPVDFMALECEKKHKCSHENIYYEVDDVGDWPCYVTGITQKCKDCHTVFGEISFDALENLRGKNKILEKVYNSFKDIEEGRFK